MNDAPLMLTVSGLRGLVGRSLTPAVAARYGAALGEWLKTQSGGKGSPRVVVGRDSRPSGQMLELATEAGLISVGCQVISLGIVTTPSVAIMVEQLKADGGVVITASHNPIVWNGVKSLSREGVAPPLEQAKEIIRRFQGDEVSHAPVEQLVPMERDESTNRVHVGRVLAHIDVQAIRKRKIKVVLDSVHGAGGEAGAMLLRELGVELVHLYAEATGLFPHMPEPTRENLTGLCEAVRQHRADIGFAQDPDADRLAVVDDLGNYIGEEYTLALACMHVLDRPDCPAKPVLVANLSTSRMIDDIAAKKGARVVRSPVGEANVAAAMRAHGSVIGGEGNGGVIWPKVVYVRDSLVGMALLLELLAKTGEPVSKLIERMPRYAIVKDKVDTDPAVVARYADSLVQRYRAVATIDLQDGVRIDWPGRWVHVRPSNTEPILRIIAEAADATTAQQMIQEVRKAVGIRA